MDIHRLRKISPDTVCVYPFSYVNFTPHAHFTPCCASEYGLAEPVSGSPDIFNSQSMTRIRHEMITGKKSRECASCWKSESLGSKSLRQESFENHFLAEGLNLKNLDLQTGVLKTSPTTVKISLSNDCNIQCRMCNGDFSSRWDTFYKKYSDFGEWVDKHGFEKTMYQPKPINKEEYFGRVLEFIQKHGDKIRRLEFIGGEPLIQPMHFRLLKELRKNAKKLNLDYSSNLMKLGNNKDNVFDYWPEFSKIGLTVSIDGAGALNDYIRSGSDYRVLEENIKAVHGRLKHYEFFSFTAISIYNAFNIVDVAKYTTRLGLLFISGVVDGPVFLSAQILPKAAKKVITERVNHFLKNIDKEMATEFDNPIWHSSLKKLFLKRKTLGKLEQIERLQRRLTEFMNFMNAEDQSHLLPAFFEFDDLFNRLSGKEAKLKDVAPELDALRAGVKVG